MRSVRMCVVRRCAAAMLVAAAASAPTGVGASPAGPDQEDPAEDARRDNDRTLVDAAEVLAQDDPAAFTGALEDLNATVNAQLDALNQAESAVDSAVETLNDADSAVQETEFRIEALNTFGDQVVADAFISPPTEAGFEMFQADTITDAAIKRMVLDIQADSYADILDELDVERDELEENQATQEEARSAADDARADAETALADLESSVSQQAQFVLDVREWIDGQGAEADADPELAEAIRARQAEVAAQLQEYEEAAAYAAALEALAEAERQRELAGRIVCPVQGPVEFTDTWGAPRSGGRAHKGVDMLADIGQPTPAPASGRVEHRGTSLGGMSWYVYGDNGDTYYGTHLSAYENQGAGHVEAGEIIGYVGDSGNAAGIPHLHFEIMPGGGASVNPYPKTAEACF